MSGNNYGKLKLTSLITGEASNRTGNHGKMKISSETLPIIWMQRHMGKLVLLRSNVEEGERGEAGIMLY